MREAFDELHKKKKGYALQDKKVLDKHDLDLTNVKVNYYLS